jgi:hypothetical protein
MFAKRVHAWRIEMSNQDLCHFFHLGYCKQAPCLTVASLINAHPPPALSKKLNSSLPSHFALKTWQQSQISKISHRMPSTTTKRPSKFPVSQRPESHYRITINPQDQPKHQKSKSSKRLGSIKEKTCSPVPSAAKTKKKLLPSHSRRIKIQHGKVRKPKNRQKTKKIRQTPSSRARGAKKTPSGVSHSNKESWGLLEFCSFWSSSSFFSFFFISYSDVKASCDPVLPFRGRTTSPSPV